MDNYSQMTDEQKEELRKAISKLSEEDQMQIVGAGEINDKQCEKLQKINPRVITTITAYGGPIIRPSVLSPEVIERWKQKQKEKEKELQGRQDTESGKV